MSVGNVEIKIRHGKKCWECRDGYRKPDPCKNTYIYETAREWHVKGDNEESVI